MSVDQERVIARCSPLKNSQSLAGIRKWSVDLVASKSLPGSRLISGTIAMHRLLPL